MLVGDVPSHHCFLLLACGQIPPPIQPAYPQADLDVLGLLIGLRLVGQPFGFHQ